MEMVDYSGAPPGYELELLGFQVDEDKAVFEGCHVKTRPKRGVNPHQDYSGQIFLLSFDSTPPRPVIRGEKRAGMNPISAPRKASSRGSGRKGSTGTKVCCVNCFCYIMSECYICNNTNFSTQLSGNNGAIPKDFRDESGNGRNWRCENFVWRR